MRRLANTALILGIACGSLPAQQLIGYVPTRDADITGATDELNGRAVLTGSASVTAKDHTAPITLGRGGTVNVCQTSVVHVTENRAVSVNAPLLFSLDRGAIEIRMTGTPTDAIMTPDLRFTVRAAGPLDLRLRVARNGDTCVESRGNAAPTLAVTDPFGTEMYELNAGQHVLFEHGSLHDVVDRETSPCGCPEPKGVSLADAILAKPADLAPKPGPKTETPPPAQIPEAHPFPTAISEELAPPEELPPVPAPQVPAQIADGLVYNGTLKDPDALPPQDRAGNSASPAKPKPAAVPAPAPEPPPVVQAVAAAPAPLPPPPPPPEPEPAKPAAPVAPEPPAKDVAHVVGRFFHKLFGRK